MISEQEFRTKADEALAVLSRALAGAADRLPLESDLSAGALAVEFEDPPAKFVVSPNAPVRQIWVSAHSRSYKLDWHEEQGAFVLADSGQSLKQLIEEAISRQLGEPVRL